jgi:site-specific DNA-methyltransferase (adenine-specific)
MTTLSLLHGDCLELMKTLPDKSVDMFLCDLPYGTVSCEWDVQINLDKFWEQVERLMKHDNVPIIHFCTMRFGFDLMQSKRKWFRYDIVWEKGNACGFLLANKQPMRAHENIFVFAKKGAQYQRKDIEGDFKRSNGGCTNSNVYGLALPPMNPDNTGKRCLRSVIKVGTGKYKGAHPTQKPKELYKILIERYCPEGGTVLDPTAGSFNSCFAAQELGRHAIGIEKDKKFYDKAVALTNVIEHV